MSKTAPSQIPHGLDLVIDFVNTHDLEAGVDELRSPQELSDWLSRRRLLEPAAAHVDADDHADAIRLREALRALMLANNGERADAGAGLELERAARAGGLGVHFAGDGAVATLATAEGVSGALARLLVPVAAASADGTWARAKACRADSCQWAFYDRSRNRSGTWCDMAACGNRTKVRAYRSRRSPGRRPG